LADYAPTGISGTLSLYGPASGEGIGDLIEASSAVSKTSLALGPHALGSGLYYLLVETDEGAFTDTVTYTLAVLD
jgi:hypothetical protein